jgi:hypothetical protein
LKRGEKRERWSRLMGILESVRLDGGER